MTKCNRCGNNTAEYVFGNFQTCTVCDAPKSEFVAPKTTLPPSPEYAAFFKRFQSTQKKRLIERINADILAGKIRTR
jgi:hypothetical protein